MCARTHELAPPAVDAYRLTEREREVTRLVTLGLSTDAIGARLYLSRWTAQDHLMAIFDTTGVCTRGELVARVFFAHDVPRLSHPNARDSSTRHGTTPKGDRA